MTEQLKEARMSAAVKLQRAFQRQQEKSEASRRRGEELLKQARESQQKKQQTNEETLDQAADRKKQLKKFKDMVDKRQIEEAATGNPGGGYHGTHVSADDRYDEIHAHVKNLTDADDKTVKHYLDSGHGTRLAGKEEDHAYIKKDFDKFMKYYRPKSYEKKDKIQEVLTKDTPASEVIKDFVHSDNPKFAGKSKEKRKQMALAAYYAKQRNEEVVHEGTVQPSGTDKIEVAGNEVPANKSKGKTVNQFKFFTKESVDTVNESYDFDTAAMAKQELADVKNKKHRGRGKVANLLRKLGMKEEVEHLDEKITLDGNGKVVDHGPQKLRPKNPAPAGSKSDSPGLHSFLAAQRKKRAEGQAKMNSAAEKLKGTAMAKEEVLREARVEIEKDEYEKIKQKHKETSTANRYGNHANSLHVYHNDNGHVVNQTYAHHSHGLPTIEHEPETGKHYKYVKEEVEKLDEISKETAKSYVVKKMDKIAATGGTEGADKVKKNIDAMQGAHERIVGAKPTSPKKLKEFIETLKEGKVAVDVNKVNAAGQEPHEEKWEDAKKKQVKKESFTAEELLQALKEGLWPGTPEHTAKFGDKYKQSQGGGSGIKKGSRYGGSLQKDEPDHDEDDEPKKAGRKVGSKSGARSTGTSKLINKQ